MVSLVVSIPLPLTAIDVVYGPGVIIVGAVKVLGANIMLHGPSHFAVG